jgi:[ribosomal protein S5]-alanine N-acetyltransferase
VKTNALRDSLITSDEIALRRWLTSDVDALVCYANNRNVWLSLRDRFPYPYSESDARAWLALCSKQSDPISQFAIEFGGSAIGGIGFEAMSDVHRFTAEIGYWLGEPFWGRGIATVAVERATTYGFATLGLERIEAHVFGTNLASSRVLEKAGYSFEGRLRRRVFKDGRLLDSYLYARVP